MQIVEINDKKKWDSFIKKNNGHFLQSYDWGYFQKSLGRKIWYLAAVNNNDIIEAMLLIKMPLKFGYSWLYTPRWKIYTNIEGGKEIINRLKDLALLNKAIFFKTDPYILKSKEFDEKIFGLEKSYDEIQPQNTLILNLSKTKEELLKQMHYKTRYNIKLALEKGVKIEWSKNKDDIKYFVELLNKTAARKSFISHSEKYYKNLVEYADFKIALAYYNDKPVAANLMKFFGNTAIYVHGATDYEFRNLMAPHLLQWECILKSKELGYQYYDFWGVQGKDKKKSSWAGFTRFKQGFAQHLEITEYKGIYAAVFKQSLYFVYNFLKGLFSN